MLIVGTRGMSELKGMFINSVSKYCLQHSPVPVVVVRPENKVKKQKEKKAGKNAKRLSGMFRISSHSSISSMNSKGSDSQDSSSEDDEVAAVEKKVQRLSVFDKIGRHSRSSSPVPPSASKK